MKEKKKRKRFTSEKSAKSFAKKVNGVVNDLREIEDAKSNFSVTYKQSAKTIKHGNRFANIDEYPEEYWKD